MDHDSCHVDIVKKPFEGEIPESVSQAQLALTGMGCPNCAARIHNALVQMDGVFKADVMLENGLARVFYDSERVEPANLLLAVELIGKQSHHNYQAQLIT